MVFSVLRALASDLFHVGPQTGLAMFNVRIFLLLALCSFQFACANTSENGSIKPFSTDGCSRFPDRSLISNHDWCHCCVAHDLAYWRGGTEEEKRIADNQLRECVAKTTDNKALADLMFVGVRVGGGPYFYTNYRWGYGWKYGRGYQPLSPSEQASVVTIQYEYMAQNATLSCNAETTNPSSK